MNRLWVVCDMEFEEIKMWVNNVPESSNNNKGILINKAILIIIDIIYRETEDRISDIKKFYDWFSNEWKECAKYITPYNWCLFMKSGDEKINYYSHVGFVKCLKYFYNTRIKNLFSINKELEMALKPNTFFPTLERIVNIENGEKQYKAIEQDILWILQVMECKWD